MVAILLLVSVVYDELKKRQEAGFGCCPREWGPGMQGPSQRAGKASVGSWAKFCWMVDGGLSVDSKDESAQDFST